MTHEYIFITRKIKCKVANVRKELSERKVQQVEAKSEVGEERNETR